MLFVIGASGRMGGAVLAAATGPTRAGSRSGRAVPGADETVRFDIDDPSAQAMRGCDALFLMRPPATTTRLPFERVMRAAAKAGVAHVICASVWGAGSSRVLPHRHMEAAVRESGIAFTFLRPADFMQNLFDVHGEGIRTRGEIAVPAGAGRSAFLDVRDVGSASAVVLADPAAHAGRAYNLTGPDALSFGDVARTLTQVLGRPIRYRPVSAPRFVLEHRRSGHPLALSLVMAALYTVQRIGSAAPVSNDFEHLTGEAPGDLAAYAFRVRAELTA